MLEAAMQDLVQVVSKRVPRSEGILQTLTVHRLLNNLRLWVSA